MRRFSVRRGAGGLVVPAMAALLLSAAGTASAATRHVCPGCRYTQLAPAVAASRNGDTIRVASGIYAGGVRIDVSVKLVGAGPRSTIIKGGGSVLTIGAFGASREPTVSIAGVTITGGVARSSPESKAFVGQAGVEALGGGVEIPPRAHGHLGATVKITNSVITGNRVAPTHALPLGPPCPGGRCPFALAAGGGIDNWGTLTLTNTTVSANRVGSASGLSTLASDANGGAIMNNQGTLTITHTTITGNQASATAPNGRFADSGAIFVEGGALRMHSSAVTHNNATLAASLPKSVDLLAIGGGIHIGTKASATIRDTTISRNSVSMTNSVGNATAFSGGLHTDVDVQLSNDVIANNSVSSTALPGSSGNAEGDSGAGEMSGTISHPRLTGNTVTVSSAAGDATAFAGATIVLGLMTNGVVNGNHVRAFSPRGSVSVLGGGLTAGPLTLRNTTVRGNTGYASGLTGTARGGGIFAAVVPNGPPGGPLNLANSSVTRNTLSGTTGITLQGAGIFATNPVTLTNSVIMANSPDQCHGCQTTRRSPHLRPPRAARPSRYGPDRTTSPIQQHGQGACSCAGSAVPKSARLIVLLREAEREPRRR